jgi:hypothetical protein
VLAADTPHVGGWNRSNRKQSPPSENWPLTSAHADDVVFESQVSYVSDVPDPSMTELELVARWIQDPLGSVSQPVAKSGRPVKPLTIAHRATNDVMLRLQLLFASRHCSR